MNSIDSTVSIWVEWIETKPNEKNKSKKQEKIITRYLCESFLFFYSAHSIYCHHDTPFFSQLIRFFLSLPFSTVCRIPIHRYIVGFILGKVSRGRSNYNGVLSNQLVGRLWPGFIASSRSCKLPLRDPRIRRLAFPSSPWTHFVIPQCCNCAP